LEKNLREYSHGAFMGAASASSERRPNKLKGVIGFYGIKNAELGAELLRHVAMELFARGCRNVAANTVSWDYEEEKDTILSVLREAGFGSQLGYDIMSNDTKTSPRQITAVLPDRECLGQLRSSPDLKFKKEFLEKLVRG
jgi:hypothetical protein